MWYAYIKFFRRNTSGMKLKAARQTGYVRKWGYFAESSGSWSIITICMLIFVALDNSLIIYRHHHCRRRAVNLVLYSALIAIEGYLDCHINIDPRRTFSVYALSIPHLTIYVKYESNYKKKRF